MSRLPATKRRRLSPPEETTATATNRFRENASKWNLEEDYEKRLRERKGKDKKSNRLPIKTGEGRVEEAPVADPIAEPEDEESDSFLGSGDDEEADGAEEEEETEAPAPQPQTKESIREQIINAKEELAKAAGLISEDPEEHIGQLKHMAQLAASRNMTVKKIALAAQLAVYKDIIPGYRIRPVSDEEMKAKLSKDVRKMRDFEQGLVRGYQDYVKGLKRFAKWSTAGSSEVQRSVASVAISCACQLLNIVPHFNFRDQLLQLIVDKFSKNELDSDFVKCREALETLFTDDEGGNASLEAVGLLTKMMKTKSYKIHESVLNTFLHLRLLSEFSRKGAANRIDKDEDNDQPVQKMRKKDREFRSKKQRKLMKERKGIEKEMVEADAAVSHEERDKNQAETLKLVFVAYFRILKARIPSLMGAVLEGLARYAHLINQDFFGDILDALRDLITTAEAKAETAADSESGSQPEESSAPRDISRESLLCAITAFALLQGQDASKSAHALHLDLNFFITHLYRTLLPASLNADIESSSKSLHQRLASETELHPNSRATAKSPRSKINVQTTIVLLLRCLTSVLLPPLNTRAVPPLRVAAFTKQLLTASLHLPEKSCLAMIGLLRQVMKVHGGKVAALWYSEERKGDGRFDAERDEVESSNPFAGTVWEGEILRVHYSELVREGAKGLEGAVVKSR